MRKLIIYLTIFLLLVMPAISFGKVKPKHLWRKSLGGNFTMCFVGTSAQRDAVPDGVWTVRTGDQWYNTADGVFYTYNSSGAWVDTASAGSGMTLGNAYNFGGAGAGKAVTVNDGAVAFTTSDNDTGAIVTLTHSGTSTGDGMTITLANGSADGIEFENTGSGYDIEGTAALWYATKAGLLYGTTITSAGDVTLTGAASNVLFDASSNQIEFTDDAFASFGSSDDFTIEWDTAGTDGILIEQASQDGGIVKIGSTNASDWAFYANTNTNIATFNSGNATLEFDGYDVQLQDADILAFGDGDDYTITSPSAGVLTFAPAAVDGTPVINYGVDGAGAGAKYFMEASGDYILINPAGEEMYFEDAELVLNEGSDLIFRDSGDATDWVIDLTTAEELLFLPTETTDDQVIAFGNATYTTDLNLFGATASTVAFDASGDKVTFNAYDVLLGDDDVLEFGDSAEITMQYDEDGDNDLQITGDVTLEGTTPLLTIGDAGTEDTVITFDGAAQDFYIGLDDTDDDLNIGLGSTPGTTAAIEIDENQNVAFTQNVLIEELNFAADGEASDTYAITLAPAPASYVTGTMIIFTATTANTGACTINVNGLGAKALLSLNNVVPPDNYIEAGSVVVAVYDGTSFQMVQPDANP